MVRSKATYNPEDSELGGHPDEPIANFVSCHTGIKWSPVGPCDQGTILRADDARVVALPQYFRPLLELVVPPPR